MGYRYIGSKARIAEEILSYLGGPSREDGRFIDAFAGTGVVAETAAKYNWPIHLNDMMKNAIVMSEARLISKQEIFFSEFGGYTGVIETLNALKGEEGFLWREYSPASVKYCGLERKYFTEENAKKIDAITSKIHQWKREGTISEKEFPLLMTDLIRATNNIANIAGTYGCFLSKWTSQALRPLVLEPSTLRQNRVNYTVSNLDVFDVPNDESDIVYLDPPYTKRQYASYYHILETIVCGDQPNVEGVSGLRPWKDKSSVFCYKAKALNALSALIIGMTANRVLLSYSNEGHVALEDLVERLEPHGEIKVIEIGTIGRYRPNKVAVENNSEVKEYLIDFQRKRI